MNLFLTYINLLGYYPTPRIKERMEFGMVVVEKLINEYLDQTSELFDHYRTFYQKPSDIPLAKAFIKERFERQDSAIFVARENDPLLGFVQLYPSFSSLSAKPVLILNDLFVLPQARGKGVGQLLLDKAAQYGREQGAKYLSLSTAIDNSVAQSLYEKNDYVRDTEFYHYSLEL